MEINKYKANIYADFTILSFPRPTTHSPLKSTATLTPEPTLPKPHYHSLSTTFLPPLSKVRCCRPKKFGRLPEGLYSVSTINEIFRTIPLAFRTAIVCVLIWFCICTIPLAFHTAIVCVLIWFCICAIPLAFRRGAGFVKSNMVYTLCKHMVYMLSITNEHKNELEIRAKPEWKVHFLCFASAKRGSFSIR